MKIKIGKNLIGKGEPCFIIAEAGVNHNGSLDLAKKLIDAACKAGVDAVKFQTFKAEDLVTENANMFEYQKKNTGENCSQLTFLKRMELKYDDFLKLKEYCDKKGILFLSTPHTEGAVDFLEPLVPAYKIGSGDLTNIPVLEKIAKKGKPIILSTGMANLKEVKDAVKAIKRAGNSRIVLLHCTTNYPCPIEEVNLKAMLTLKKEFNLPVGYSDHTEGIVVPAAAVALEARVIEKHFTLDNRLIGPDHKASLEPNKLKEMVVAIRKTEQVLGIEKKIPTDSENRIKNAVRKSIAAEMDIRKGTRITRAMLAIKRPGTGILPKDLHKVIGKVARRDIKRNTIIKFADLK